MDSLTDALLEAWAVVKPRLLADTDELRARLARRRSKFLTRPLRPTCAAIRASDRRINPMSAAISPYRNADPADPDEHEVRIDARLIQSLCQPVDLRTWRGQDLQTAAKKLGLTPDALHYQMRKGMLKVDRIKGLLGRRTHVPLVWTDRVLDPGCANAFAPPHEVWSGIWQWVGQAVPDDFVQTITRVPAFRPFPGYKTQRFRGWRWICPGCQKRVRTLYYPTRVVTLPEYFGDEPILLAAAGADPDGPDAVQRPSGTLACNRCHRVRNWSAIDHTSWNHLVACLSGGLLYGREVKRPADLVLQRRRKFAPHKAHHPREAQVERLLLSGKSYAEVALEMGVALSTVQGHVKRLYRRRSVHSRRQLRAKNGLHPRPSKKRAGVRVKTSTCGSRQPAQLQPSRGQRQVIDGPRPKAIANA